MARPLMQEAQNVASTFDRTSPAGAADLSFDGGARRLQQELERALSGAGEPRWSARRSLGFIVVTNGAFWIAAVWALKTILS